MDTSLNAPLGSRFPPSFGAWALHPAACHRPHPTSPLEAERAPMDSRLKPRIIEPPYASTFRLTPRPTCRLGGPCPGGSRTRAPGTGPTTPPGLSSPGYRPHGGPGPSAHIISSLPSRHPSRAALSSSLCAHDIATAGFRYPDNTPSRPPHLNLRIPALRQA
jgi:hypothetical protein